MPGMTTKRQNLLERVASLPEELLDEVDESLEEIIHLHAGPAHRPSDEDLAGIDRGIAAAREGRFATEEEIKKVLAGFRNA